MIVTMCGDICLQDVWRCFKISLAHQFEDIFQIFTWSVKKSLFDIRKIYILYRAVHKHHKVCSCYVLRRRILYHHWKPAPTVLMYAGVSPSVNRTKWVTLSTTALIFLDVPQLRCSDHDLSQLFTTEVPGTRLPMKRGVSRYFACRSMICYLPRSIAAL